MPKICLAGLISFIAKDMLKAFFKLAIFFRSCLAINIQQEDKEVSYFLLLHEDTVVNMCLVEAVFYHEEFKFPVPLPGRLLQPIQALPQVAY